MKREESKYMRLCVCGHCGKEYLTYLPPSYIREGRGKVCSRQCSGKQNAKIMAQDIPAIVEMSLDNSMSTPDIAAHFGCSTTLIRKALRKAGCPRDRANYGEQNGRYSHGRYVNEHVYRHMVSKDLCAKCGSTKDLAIHHVNLEHSDNTLDNLQVLCASCHNSLHMTLYWRAKKPHETAPRHTPRPSPSRRHT